MVKRIHLINIIIITPPPTIIIITTAIVTTIAIFFHIIIVIIAIVFNTIIIRIVLRLEPGTSLLRARPPHRAFPGQVRRCLRRAPWAAADNGQTQTRRRRRC